MHKTTAKTVSKPTQLVELEQISGVIERITFYNEDNGFFVIKLQPTAKFSKLITVIGCCFNLTVGEYAKCYGTWVKDKIHGLQFKTQEIKLTAPDNIAGIEKYLSSGLIKGIGPSFAKKLTAVFGAKILDIIDNNPEKLRTVPGIGANRYNQIITAWSEQKQIRKIIIFLNEHGIGTARAIRIYKIYREQAIEKIKDNPYRLALDIHGIGFKTADNLAISLGIPKDSVIRAEAGVRFILQNLINTGNCAIDLQQLITITIEQLQISQQIIIQAITREIAADRLIVEDYNLNTFDSNKFLAIPVNKYQEYLVFLKYIHYAENYIAKQILALSQAKPYWHNQINVEQEITTMQQYAKIQFSNSQYLAIKTAVQNKLVIITGGPGVGKTTVARSILHIIATKTNKILLCAPTGKAAKRLAESTNMLATTLHRMLAFDPKTRKFKYDQDNLLDVKLVLVDEVSMIDLLMFSSLLKALPMDCSLILMGDVDQLPSVGVGAVLLDLIRSDCVRFVVLREIFRQSSNSKIVVNAHRINQGKLPLLENLPDTDFYFIKLTDLNLLPDKMLQIITRLKERFGFNLNKDIQILSPMNKGIAGVGCLNNLLQKKFNRHANNAGCKITKFGNEFIVGDKIIQIINNYDKEVFNGDVGTIDSINIEDTKLTIKFEDRLIDYEFDELDEITLAYAVTIHKSQGSEYPVVIVPISMQHYSLLQKNLIYTAVTRGKSLVILVGEIKALAIAVKNTSQARVTRLTERLMANCRVHQLY